MSIKITDKIVYALPYIVQKRKPPGLLLQNRMLDAEVMIGCLVITATVVVIQNQMLAFVAHDFGNALEIFSMFGNDKRTRLVGNDHSGGIYITALIVDRSSVLRRADRDVRRIPAVAVLRPVGAGDINCVIRIIKSSPVIILCGKHEKIGQSAVNRGKRLRVRAIDRVNVRSARRGRGNAENVAGNSLRLI